MKRCKICNLDHPDDIPFCKKCGKLLPPNINQNQTNTRDIVHKPKPKIKKNSTSFITQSQMKRDDIFRNSRHNSIAIKDNKIFFLNIYQPYNRGYNSNFNEYSRKILAFKNYWSNRWLFMHFMTTDDELEKYRIDILIYFYDILEQVILFNENYVVCVVPSHKEGRQPSGIRELAKLLVVEGFIDGTQVIYREKTVEEKADGGIRDFNIEIDSLSIKHKEIIKNKRILLMDDVTTSGTSFRACEKLLYDGGAKHVVPLALGKTRNKYDRSGIKLWTPS